MDRGSDRVVFETLGQTSMNKPFVMATISSPANLARLEEFKQIQETVGGAKSAVDAMFEHVKGTVKEMVEHVKPTADLLNDRQQNPWFLMGSAIVMGYILGSLARENTFVR